MTHSNRHSASVKHTFGVKKGIALAFLLLVNTTTLAEEDGESVYKQVCKSCHGGGIKGWLSGAPKAGKDSAWKEYFSISLAEIKANIYNGTDKHEGMGEKEGLSENAVGAAVDHIIALTPSLSESAKQ